MSSYSEKEDGASDSPNKNYLQRAERMRKQGDVLFKSIEHPKYGTIREKLLVGSLNSYQGAIQAVSDARSRIRGGNDSETIDETFGYITSMVRKNKDFAKGLINYLQGKDFTNTQIKSILSAPNKRGAILFLDYESSLLNPKLNEAKSELNIFRSRQHAAAKLEARVQNSAPTVSRVTGTLSILTLFAALFFLSFNFTGAAIGSVSADGSLWIGLGLILAGIALAFVYFRENDSKKAKNSKKIKKK